MLTAASGNWKLMVVKMESPFVVAWFPHNREVGISIYATPSIMRDPSKLKRLGIFKELETLCHSAMPFVKNRLKMARNRNRAIFCILFKSEYP